MTKRSRIVARLLCVALGLVIALPVLEAGLRLFRPEPPLLWVPDPVLGRVFQPGVEILRTGGEGQAIVRINRLGLRDHEFDVAKPSGIYRIVVLGDSMVAGEAVALDETFPKVAEKLLRADASDGQQVQVVNAGFPGYGTAQEYLWLKRDGVRLGPDLVVLAFFVGNDIRDNSLRLDGAPMKPFFVLDSGELRPSGASFYADNPAKAWLRNHSHLYRSLLLARYRLTAAMQSQSEDPGKPDGLTGIETPESKEARQVTWQLLKAMNRLAQEHGFGFALMILPDPAQVSRNISSVPPEDRERPQRSLMAFAEAEGIVMMDALPCLREHHREDAPIFFRHRGHFTVHGHRLAGEFLYRHLRVRSPEGTRARGGPGTAAKSPAPQHACGGDRA